MRSSLRAGWLKRMARATKPHAPSTTLELKNGAVIAISSSGDPTTRFFIKTALEHGACVSWLTFEDILDRKINLDVAAAAIDRAPGVYLREASAIDPHASAIIRALCIKHPNCIMVPLASTNWCKPYHVSLINRLTLTYIRAPISRLSTMPLSTGEVVKNSSSAPTYVLNSDENTEPDFPVFVQERIHGQEFRVHVLDGEVFSCSIVTDELDYRTDPNSKLYMAEVPIHLHDDLRCLAESEGLRFAGIDLIIEEAGSVVAIEVNPMPGYHVYDLRPWGDPASLTQALFNRLWNRSSVSL